MKWAFMSYFFRYIFWGKNRQRLLFVALCGLLISSFSLLVLQSTMGGLQRNLILRSKNVTGTAVLFLNDKDPGFIKKILTFLQQEKIEAYPEYEIELLLRHDTYITPAIVHAVDFKAPLPHFLKGKELRESIMGVGLLNRVRASYGSTVNLISPSHTNSFLGEVPRQISTVVSDIYISELSEIDDYHLWVRSGAIHNLIRSRFYNTIRIYTQLPSWVFFKEKLQENFGSKVFFKSWEEQNESLVWSLNLETKVMLFLFIAMTCLVGIAITSGLLIFFGKIQIDLVSFWMLGISRQRLEKLSFSFIHLLSLGACFAGLMMGGLFLFLLDRYSGFIMPEIFLEQKIPIYITLQGIIISWGIPYLFAVFFSWISLNHFRKDQRSFTAQMRSMN